MELNNLGISVKPGIMHYSEIWTIHLTLSLRILSQIFWYTIVKYAIHTLSPLIVSKTYKLNKNNLEKTIKDIKNKV